MIKLLNKIWPWVFLFLFAVVAFAYLVDVTLQLFKKPSETTEIANAIRCCAIVYLMVNLGWGSDSDKEGES